MLGINVWRRMLGVDRATVIESVDIDEETDAVVAQVRPRRDSKRRCGRCGVRAPLYDRGEGRRRWRGLDLGTVMCFLESDAPRVSCPEHGPIVAQVPWARHGAGHTREFDDQAAWLVTHTPKTAVSELMRIAWRTVGSIIARVVADGRAAHDPFDGLRRIGIDEISYKKGHRYLMVVVDHDTGRLVWAAPGRDKKTLRSFFDLLGTNRCRKVRLVSADAAEWIADVVRERCPGATVCTDGFHVVGWATDALDEVRRDVWNTARRQGMRTYAKEIKGCRYALWKNPEDLTERQEAKLAWISAANTRLYRAYLLKEQLRVAIGKEPHHGVRRAGAEDPQEPPGDRGSDAPQALQRAHRVHEHEDPRPAPDGLRVQEARAPRRPRPARSRRLLPPATRTGSGLMDPRMRQESRNCGAR